MGAATTYHYDTPGGSPAWTASSTNGWTRNITGIDGSLVAIQTNGETPTLQLTDLRGDIVATASMSETATGPTSTTEPSEYGVPTAASPAKYSWLGAAGTATELPSGFVAMGARSYIASLGRFLQSDPDPAGSAKYTYTYGDPIDESDPSGEYPVGPPSQALIDITGNISSEAAAEQAAINAAARHALEEQRARQKQEYEEHVAAEAAAQAAEQAAFWAVWNAGIAEAETSGSLSFIEYGAAGHGTPAPKPGSPGYHPGNPNEGGTGPCRSGGKVVGGKCQPGSGGGGFGNTCRTVAGATFPLAAASGPGGISLWVAGFVTCWDAK